MKKFSFVLLSLSVVVILSAWAQTNLTISSFDSSSGQLVFNEVDDATNYFVMQSSDLSSGWDSAGGSLDSISPSGSGTITCTVPVDEATSVFYRVGAQIAEGPSLPPPTNMVLIPAGSFDMGNSITNEGFASEVPVHTVNISSFYIGTNEVSHGQWLEVYQWATTNGYSFSYEGTSKYFWHPVHTVSWYDCVKWCNAFSEMESRTPCYSVGGDVYRTGVFAPACNWTASGYRLPTEAEWEKAGRGGVEGNRFPWGNAITHYSANYYSTTNYVYDVSLTRGYHPTHYDWPDWPYTAPVGSLGANGYGMLNMGGNVREWCWDRFNSSYYSSSPATNPRGPSSSSYSYRVVRGGTWGSYAEYCRVSYRSSYSPSYGSYYVGFRVCVSASE